MTFQRAKKLQCFKDLAFDRLISSLICRCLNQCWLLYHSNQMYLTSSDRVKTQRFHWQRLLKEMKNRHYTKYRLDNSMSHNALSISKSTKKEILLHLMNPVMIFQKQNLQHVPILKIVKTLARDSQISNRVSIKTFHFNIFFSIQLFKTWRYVPSKRLIIV